MIFLRIAGTATPVFLIAAHGAAWLAGLITIWTLTLTAVGIHMAWMNAPDRLVGGTFVGLGCVAGLALPQVWLPRGLSRLRLRRCGMPVHGDSPVHHLNLPVRASLFLLIPTYASSPLVHSTRCSGQPGCEVIAIGAVGPPDFPSGVGYHDEGETEAYAIRIVLLVRADTPTRRLTIETMYDL
jgi:Haemolysin-III related